MWSGANTFFIVIMFGGRYAGREARKNSLFPPSLISENAPVFHDVLIPWSAFFLFNTSRN